MDNCIVISLASRKDRQVDLAQRLFYGGIEDFKQIEAITPQDPIVKTLDSTWDYDKRLKNMNKNEARKACYLSHLKALKEAGDKPCIILEDDIIFKKPNIIKDTIDIIPIDGFACFYDTTHVEYLHNKSIPLMGEGFDRINPKDVRVWCLGCTYYRDPKSVYKNLSESTPKRLVDKMIIDLIQKQYPTYVFTGACKQDRSRFGSNIC